MTYTILGRCQRTGRVGMKGTTLFKTDAFLEAHPFGTVPAAFSPDGTILATISRDKTIRLWNVTDPARPNPAAQPLSAGRGGGQ